VSEPIESRPTGFQVITVRLPTEVAQRLFDETRRRNTRLSDLVLEGVELVLACDAQSSWEAL
jgi:hypothetical protein